MTALNKLILLYVSLAMILFSGCTKKKGCDPVPPHQESARIVAYAQANGTYLAHASGLYYEILDEGSGPAVSSTSKIFITYIAKLLDGTVFDRMDVTNRVGWGLSGLIEGWRIGVPLIRKGGHIRLIIPSALGYGCVPSGPLPANSILFFDIRLVDVQ